MYFGGRGRRSAVNASSSGASPVEEPGTARCSNDLTVAGNARQSEGRVDEYWQEARQILDAETRSAYSPTLAQALSSFGEVVLHPLLVSEHALDACARAHALEMGRTVDKSGKVESEL